MSHASTSRWALVAFACVAACGPKPPPQSAAAPKPTALATATPKASEPAPDPLAVPPPAGVSPDAPFPAIAHRKLDNGLELRVVTRKNYPIVELRLVLFSGLASDGPEPGLASLAGELLKAGGAGAWSADELVERAESLGANLNVHTERDSTRLSIGVTTGDLPAALEILAAMALHPRLPPAEFDKLKQRELERVRSAARASAGWAAAMILYRELFDLPTGVHPYSRYDAMPKEVQAITLDSCRRWYRSNVTPANATLVIAGDVDVDAAEALVKRVFAGWKGNKPSPPNFNAPVPPEQREVWLVDRPGSAQSQIFVGTLGPERSTEQWPALAATNQILGGGVAGRLFLDVREKRSLAYSTGSSLEEPANGPVPIVLSAGTQTAKTALALQALLENLDLIASAPPAEHEVEMAARYLSDSFLFRTETVGAVADLTVKLAVLGLADDYFDEYRRAVRHLEAEAVKSAAEHYFKTKHPVIAVAGDASRIAKSLARFGRVTIIDPEHDFAPGKQLPKDDSPAPDVKPAPDPKPPPPGPTSAAK